METVNDFLTSAERVFGSEFETFIPSILDVVDGNRFPKLPEDLVGKDAPAAAGTGDAGAGTGTGTGA